MKHISCAFIVSMSIFLTQAQIPSSAQDSLIQNQYLLKSKSQKKTAWILLGTGAVMTIAGVEIFWKDFNLFSKGTEPGLVLAVAGGVVAASSIPFFISAAQNKKKAKISVEMMHYPKLQSSTIVNSNIPAVKFTLDF